MGVLLWVGPLVGGRAQEDQSRRAMLDIAGTYQIKLGSRRTAVSSEPRAAALPIGADGVRHDVVLVARDDLPGPRLVIGERLPVPVGHPR
jgi:hypothetical protein